ncbi:MAG: hypothetical protein IT303_13040 [Dehalococcoidia bacterium]|nr:hypothetical protein [Dehalococcoidia bacterium]
MRVVVATVLRFRTYTGARSITSRQELGALLSDLDDFSVPTELPTPYLGPLPPYIPQLVRRVNFPERLPASVAITLGEFVAKSGSFRGGVNAVERLRARGAEEVILVGTSLDPQLEAAWQRPQQLLEGLGAAGIKTVLGPAFSLYTGRPPIERMANRARNLSMYARIIQGGFDAVPAVGFVDARDAEHVAGWIASRGLHTVFVDLQSAESRRSWAHVRAAIPLLVHRGGLARLVVNGIVHPDRIRELATLAKPADLVVTNAGAAHTARLGEDYFRDGRGLLVKRKTRERPERVFWNLAHYYHRVTAEPSETYLPLSMQPMML